MSKLNKKSEPPVTVIVIVVISLIVISLIVIGLCRMYSKSSEVRNNCQKTHLFVIGNKGHRTRVYDCSNSTVEIN